MRTAIGILCLSLFPASFLPSAFAGGAEGARLDFETIYEKEIGDDQWHHSEEGAMHQGALFIAGFGLLAVETETGRLLDPPEDTEERRHRLLSTPEGLVLASESPFDRGAGYTRLRLIRKIEDEAAWEKTAEIGVNSLSFRDGMLFLMDRWGNAAGLDGFNGSLLFRAPRPPDLDLPQNVSVVEYGEALFPAREALLVVTEREERLTAKVEDIPKGTPSSWERGMPEGYAYYVRKRQCVVRAFRLPGQDPKAAAGELVWQFGAECPKFIPGPSIFAAGDGAVQVFAGDKSVRLDVRTGRELSRSARETPLTHFQFAGPDTAVQLYDGEFRCFDLATLAEKWKVASGDGAFLRGCHRISRGLVTLCVFQSRSRDLITENDAVLRLHDSETGYVLASRKVSGSGSTHLFGGEEAVFLHGSSKISGFRVVKK